MARLTRALLFLALIAIPAPAAAFCGFYVASGSESISNHTTSVVLLREGTTTVLSMQNDYRGPAEDFALVVPVPVVLHRGDVRTLPREVFQHIDALGAPRLVEYWEADPCSFGTGEGTIGLGNLGTIGHGSGYGSGAGGFAPPPVRVEAAFAVGEYDVVVLGADEATALEDWLHAHGYRIPEGASEVLRPYVEEGMKFFVARVDVDRVHFDDGRAVLSPLRFHYDSERFSLPVRLGLLSADGPQDLVVNVLARGRRFEVVNHENVLVPTNLEVDDAVRTSFPAFYAALFDDVIADHPGAVVTEYAWGSGTCDPCPPDGSLPARDLASLGADVMFPGGVVESSFGSMGLVTMDIGPVTGMDREIVRRVVRRHMNEVRFCFEQALFRGAGGPSSITVHLEAHGAVDAVTTEGSDAVTACTTSAVRRWTFPTTDDGSPLTAEVTFRGNGLGATTSPVDWVLTRLHYRYDRESLGEDLVFGEAAPIVGGREAYDESGESLEAPHADTLNNFQGRFIIRHPFEGTIACEHPHRGVWGPPPSGGTPTPTVATDIGAAQRGGITLASMVRTPITAAMTTMPGTAPPAPVDPPAPTPPPAPPAPAAAPPAPAPATATGCGCSVQRSEPEVLAVLGLVVLSLWRRRRRR